MTIVPFNAESPAVALAQIQEQLGPEAVVLSMRPARAKGWSRLWRRHGGVELLAYRPDPAQEPPSESSILLPQLMKEGMGAAGHGCGLRLLEDSTLAPHIFIGPPGVGKTTLLCRWLSRAVLTRNRRPRVFRLDAGTANTAEFLSIHCEMLGIPADRYWRDPTVHSTGLPTDLVVVDMPGLDASDADALDKLQKQLGTMPSARLHLVLNAAYEMPVLLRHFHAFARFNPEDVSFTHLDEDSRQEKLRVVILGTKCSIRFLTAGQKIPGELHMDPGAAS